MSSQPTSMRDCDIVVSIHDRSLDVAMREMIEQKLQRVDELWGAAIGTPDGDELDKLIDEVEELEAE